jgi:hypothetical protein
MESKLGPLGTSATYWPIVPVPGDCEDGEFGGMNGRGNRSTRRKPAPTPLKSEWVSEWVSIHPVPASMKRYRLNICLAVLCYSTMCDIAPRNPVAANLSSYLSFVNNYERSACLFCSAEHLTGSLSNYWHPLEKHYLLAHCRNIPPCGMKCLKQSRRKINPFLCEKCKIKHSNIWM